MFAVEFSPTFLLIPVAAVISGGWYARRRGGDFASMIFYEGMALAIALVMNYLFVVGSSSGSVFPVSHRVSTLYIPLGLFYYVAVFIIGAVMTAVIWDR